MFQKSQHEQTHSESSDDESLRSLRREKGKEKVKDPPSTNRSYQDRWNLPEFQLKQNRRSSTPGYSKVRIHEYLEQYYNDLGDHPTHTEPITKAQLKKARDRNKHKYTVHNVSANSS